MIKNIMPGLTERGKIKIGEKGKMIQSQRGNNFQPPKKLDHFRVTTLNRDQDGNYEIDREVHKLYGDAPVNLPVRLLYDDIELNFQTRYTCFKGKTLWCSGDGETAQRLDANGKRVQVECTCERQLPECPAADKCKINGCLSVIIEGIERVGGVHKFRTTSYNSVIGILSSLTLIKRMTGGPLAGLPLEMSLNPKTVILPDGKISNIWVVGIEFRGSVDKLQQIGAERAEKFALHYAKMEQLEQRTLKMLDAVPVIPEEEIQEYLEEFVSEQAVQAHVDANANVETISIEAEVVEGQPEKPGF